jgi:phytoene synthase
MPAAEASVNAAQAHCRRLARRAARNFYYAFLPLSREQHNAMCAVYAFARHSDDLTDDEAPKGGLAQREALAEWERQFKASLSEGDNRDLVLVAVRRAIEQFAIPPVYFLELIGGVAVDLEPPCYRTFDELYRYCYGVASTIGLICLHVFGFQSPEAPVFAERLGVAFQLTNILRDVREDAGRGRLYLPLDDLDRFGVSRADIEQGRLDCLRDLLHFQAERAEAYYQEASPLLRLIDPRSRASLWVMTAIYHGILKRVRTSGYDVFSRRAGLSHAEKTAIMLRGLKLHLIGGNAPFPA